MSEVVTPKARGFVKNIQGYQGPPKIIAKKNGSSSYGAATTNNTSGPASGMRSTGLTSPVHHYKLARNAQSRGMMSKPEMITNSPLLIHQPSDGFSK